MKLGGNRQELHEAIRVHSMEAARSVKELGKANDLLERLKGDKLFAEVRFSGGHIASCVKEYCRFLLRNV